MSDLSARRGAYAEELRATARLQSDALVAALARVPCLSARSLAPNVATSQGLDPRAAPMMCRHRTRSGTSWPQGGR
jgi:hypothetical protein